MTVEAAATPPQTRSRSRGAWVLVAPQVAAGTAAFVLGRANASALDLQAGFRGTTADAVWLASWLGFPIVGAVILSRRRRNAVAWVLCAIGVSATFGALAATYARYGSAVAPGRPGAAVAAWVATWAVSPAALVPFLVFLFPDGRVASTRWRRVATAGVGTAVAFLVVRAFSPGAIDGVRSGAGRVENPLGLLGSVAEPLGVVLATCLTALAFASIAYTVWRFRASSGDERLQLKWFAYSAVAFPATMAVASIVDPGSLALVGESLAGRAIGTERGVVGLPLAFLVSFTGMAVAIGVAVLKHRLYAIDRIINRTVVYASLTAGLGAAYVVALLGLQALTRPITGGTDLAVAATTLALLGTFGRARRRVQAVVDRRFDRARYDAARSIERFAVGLRQQTDLDRITSDVQVVIGDTMRPSHVSLWLRGGA